MTSKREPKKAEGSQTEEGAESNGRPVVVGLGASAGGLSALKSFFSELELTDEIAFVVVVHLSPEHESHLAELLQPHVAMPVRQVTKTLPLAGGNVYVIPPNANLSAIDTHLRLSALEQHRRERAPIDHFLRTLARTHDGHAIGVILTGTGSDGTLGLREVKEKGGLTIVQDPVEAEYDGMPQSAIATGLVDLVLPLAEIPEAILRFARTQPRIHVPEETEEVPEDHRQLLQKIFAQIRARTGRDFNRYKRSTILRRIGRRMQLNQIEELPHYLRLLRDDSSEVRALADDLLITVTSFFRDPHVFQKLEQQVVPRLFEGKTPDKSVRVWSVGCATGEEAYSLAILLLEHAARMNGAHPRLQVFASDLHESSLQRGREGFYPGDIESEVSADRLKRYFVKENGGYRIRKEVREMVVFAPHNLLSDPPFSKLDLIACRNVLIYLQRDVQKEVLELFHYALQADGYLVLGTSESVEGADLFRVQDKKMCVYRRRNVPPPEPRLPVFPLTRSRLIGDPERGGRTVEPLHYGALHQRMVEQYAPPSLLVSPDDKVVHLSEHVGRYLAMPGGEPTLNVFKLVREELRIELRSVLHTARESRSAARSKPVRVRFDGGGGDVAIHVRPALEADQERFALVIFEELAEQSVTSDGSAREDRHEGTVREMEAELEMTRQRLQAIIEEYETSQEEMKASNEEFQSANEELRSTMEELETSKEELQSMNEELQTVNQENRHKVEELAQLSGDLQNLMAATEIATLFLDRDLRILRFTPTVSALFNVRMTDRGRPLSDITHRLGYGELIADAEKVLERLVPIEREVSDEAENWYLTRVLPYRSTEDRIEGVVLTFVDITARRQAEEALRHMNETLEERVEERTRQVRALVQRLTVAEQEERRRISQILHDDLQQLLYGVELKLAVIRRELDRSGAASSIDSLDEANEWVQRARRITRQLTSDLSPPILQGEGLLDEFRWLQRQMREMHNLEINIQARRKPKLDDDDLRMLIFQVVRELLFNVKKHSGVNTASLSIDEKRGELRVTVSDEGKGFDTAAEEARTEQKAGFGLSHARERLNLLGARMEVWSEPGRGTRIEIFAPLRSR